MFCLSPILEATHELNLIKNHYNNFYKTVILCLCHGSYPTFLVTKKILKQPKNLPHKKLMKIIGLCI